MAPEVTSTTWTPRLTRAAICATMAAIPCGFSRPPSVRVLVPTLTTTLRASRKTHAPACGIALPVHGELPPAVDLSATSLLARANPFAAGPAAVRTRRAADGAAALTPATGVG